jgi:hypothetical protein
MFSRFALEVSNLIYLCFTVPLIILITRKEVEYLVYETLIKICSDYKEWIIKCIHQIDIR